MIFRTERGEYRGASAVEVVDALRREAAGGRHEGQTLRQFIIRSLTEYSDRIPLREIDVSDRLDPELLALSYLYLRDEFGLGELADVPQRRRWSHPL